LKFYLILSALLFLSVKYASGQQVLLHFGLDNEGLTGMVNAKKARDERISRWTQKNVIGIDLSEVAFVNWNAGGSNSISGLAELNLARNYSDGKTNWRNTLRARFGVNSQQGREIRKTDDQLEIKSEYGYRSDTISNWFYSARFSFNTQFTNGYNYPNTKSTISQFMAPAYIFTGVGFEYGKRIESLSLYASPLTYRSTFVLDQELANRGAFGVEEAVRDADGNIIKKGENVRNELGILLSGSFQTEVLENINLINDLRLYTDYLNSFGNVDVDWELNLNFKVNTYVVAKIGSHLKYDNDVKLTQTNADGQEIVLGARTQWKQQLGIGVIVDF
jgi:hypothetical protein